MNPIKNFTKTFEITIVNDCLLDQLTLDTESITSYVGCPSTPCNEYTYYIGENTDNFDYLTKKAFEYDSNIPMIHERFFASWTTSRPYCPVGFEIKKQDASGVYQNLTP